MRWLIHDNATFLIGRIKVARRTDAEEMPKEAKPRKEKSSKPDEMIGAGARSQAAVADAELSF